MKLDAKTLDMMREMDRLVAMEAARNSEPCDCGCHLRGIDPIEGCCECKSDAEESPTGTNRVKIISTYSREIPHCVLKRTDRVQARECEGVFLVELSTSWEEDGVWHAYHYRTFPTFRQAAAAMARGTKWLVDLSNAPHSCPQCQDHY